MPRGCRAEPGNRPDTGIVPWGTRRYGPNDLGSSSNSDCCLIWRGARSAPLSIPLESGGTRCRLRNLANDANGELQQPHWSNPMLEKLEIPRKLALTRLPSVRSGARTSSTAIDFVHFRVLPLCPLLLAGGAPLPRQSGRALLMSTRFLLAGHG